MKVQAPESALNVLRDILANNQDKPQNVRVYFAGFACSGAVFSLALDEELMSDTSYDLDGIHFIMDDNEYLTYGNVTISEIAPAFEQVGGGIQYELPYNIKKLKKLGYIKEIK